MWITLLKIDNELFTIAKLIDASQLDTAHIIAPRNGNLECYCIKNRYILGRFKIQQMIVLWHKAKLVNELMPIPHSSTRKA
ncbi:MAG: hypothetical protein ACI8SE_000135 [Bacteroidia bacterium]|jgi:hypothetical protein